MEGLKTNENNDQNKDLSDEKEDKNNK